MLKKFKKNGLIAVLVFALCISNAIPVFAAENINTDTDTQTAPVSEATDNTDNTNNTENTGDTDPSKSTAEDTQENTEEAAITLDKSSLTLAKGSSSVITATITPDSEMESGCTWYSDNPNVATVNDTGLVTAVSAGTAAITAETVSGKTAVCTVTVTIPSSKIKLSKTSVNLIQGKSISLKSTLTPSDTTDTVTWSSSSTAVASVSKSGKVTAKKPGTATITAKTSSGKTAKCKVTVKLSAPTSVKTATAGISSIKISWKAVSNASGYYIYCATSKSGTYKKAATVKGGSKTSYTNKNLSKGKTYYYKVVAYGTAAKYNSAQSTASGAKTRVLAPKVTAKASSYNKIKLSWNKPSSASGYYIYRATSKTGKYTKIATIKKSSTTTYTNTVTTGTTYYYKVIAYNSNSKCNSTYSAVVSAKTKLGTVSSVKVSIKDSDSLKISWKKVAGASGYQIYRATSKNGTYKKIATVKGGTKVSYINTDLYVNKPYYYKVRAYRGKAVGSFSTVKSGNITHVYVKGTQNYTEAYNVLKFVNEERNRRGRSKLKMDKELLDAAMLRSAEIVANFDHVRPDGTLCTTASDKIYGENIAVTYNYTSAEYVMECWMDSPGHRDNILTEDYACIGIGCFECSDGCTYWVQLFGYDKANVPTKPANKNVKLRIDF